MERKDVEAAVEARRELGPAYDDEIVDTLLAKFDERLAEQAPPARPPARRGSVTPLLLGMFGCGVAVTAIAVTHGASWLAAVVWIALAYAARDIMRSR